MMNPNEREATTEFLVPAITLAFVEGLDNTKDKRAYLRAWSGLLERLNTTPEFKAAINTIQEYMDMATQAKWGW